MRGTCDHQGYDSVSKSNDRPSKERCRINEKLMRGLNKQDDEQ